MAPSVSMVTGPTSSERLGECCCGELYEDGLPWLAEVTWGMAPWGMPPRPPTPAPLPSPLCDAEGSEPEAVAGVLSGVGDDEGSLALV